MNSDQINSFIRSLFKIIGAALAAHGMTNAASFLNTKDFIGVALAIAGMVWSHFQHKTDNNAAAPPAKTPLWIIAPLLLLGLSASGQSNNPNVMPPLSGIVGKSTVTFETNGSVTVVTPSAYGTSTNNFVPATSATFGEGIVSSFQTLLTSTNMFWEAHATYANGLKQKWGGGVGGFYFISPYVYTGIRIDWVDGGFWMPQGNVGLQLPLTLASWLTVTPFTYGGIGVPLSGATVGDLTVPGNASKDNNGQATAIIGVGGAIKLFDLSSTWDFGLLGDAENWSGFSGHQYRAGLFLKKKI